MTPARRSLEEEYVTSEPRKIGEILDPALARIDTSDQARAYGAWARAAGDAVAANARPRSFARGVLTVECASSIWAQELTYLCGQLLARMNELDPAHPVQRFRFVARRSPAPPLEAVPEPATEGAPAQENEPAASKKSRRDGIIHRADLEAAQRVADEVGDERLRKAILAALGAASEEPPRNPEGGLPSTRKSDGLRRFCPSRRVASGPPLWYTRAGSLSLPAEVPTDDVRPCDAA